MPDVNKCSGWSATFYSNKLKVHGECTFPTPGFKVTLKRKSRRELTPKFCSLKNRTSPDGQSARSRRHSFGEF